MASSISRRETCSRVTVGSEHRCMRASSVTTKHLPHTIPLAMEEYPRAAA